jgi:hypothetical protein
VVIAIVAALALLGVVAITPVNIPLQQQQAYAAAQTFTVVEKNTFDETVFVPCAADGEGEEVDLTGTANIVGHVTIDDAGGGHVALIENFHESGTGLTTGDKYEGAGVFQDQINSKVGVERTSNRELTLVGQGDGNNFTLHITFHVTLNADGTLTTVAHNFKADCK